MQHLNRQFLYLTVRQIKWVYTLMSNFVTQFLILCFARMPTKYLLVKSNVINYLLCALFVWWLHYSCMYDILIFSYIFCWDQFQCPGSLTLHFQTMASEKAGVYCSWLLTWIAQHDRLRGPCPGPWGWGGAFGTFVDNIFSGDGIFIYCEEITFNKMYI